MSAGKTVFDRYEQVSERCRNGRPGADVSNNDRIIWYVISTYCEMDMEGFTSVFEQLLSEEELLFLIESLARIDEPKLADAFRRAHVALQRVGFYQRPGAMCDEFGPELETELDQIEESLRESPWSLDEKLAALID